MLRKSSPLLAMFILVGQFLFAQVTTSRITGFVHATGTQALEGATVTAVHEPTGAVYRTQSRKGGKFELNNLNPGGPYRFEVSYTGFETSRKGDINLILGDNPPLDFELGAQTTQLTAVTVTAVRPTQGRGGTETSISRDRVANLPTVGRNITDLLRAVPQAKLGTTEGSISIAGQNNRYNSFYIDGALNNDVFGIAASGTNGGQANVAPISLDAIDQIQVSISPYDASLGGFTGGAINAITRSGTNDYTGSLYYIFRNENLAGKTPTGAKDRATRLSEFMNKTYGFRVGGPIIKNKLFYFLNAEWQRDERPQPFDTAQYRGNTRPGALLAFADTLRSRYGYDPGGFINNPEQVRANRVVAKLDWNASDMHKVSLSYRFNDGERFNTSSSSSSTINFYNNGYTFPSTNHSGSGELRSSFRNGSSNRLLLTYTNVNDNRDPLGQRFPRVSITDGSGTVVFGPDNSSTVNLLTQKNYNLFDVYRFNLGKHTLSVGTDNELNDVYNAFIQNTFGNYQYNSLADFLNNARPRQYQVGYSLIDNKTDETTEAAAKFKTLRLAFFANDEFRPNPNLTLNLGLRADHTSFLTEPRTDPFTNDTALARFAQYYDLKGARSGQKPKIPWAFSPRAGFTYRIPDEQLTIRGGLGMFTGRIPLVWPGGIYNSNGINQGGFTASSSQNPAALDLIRFRSDPMNQYRATDVNITLTKGPLNLVSEKFRLPRVFRTSLAVDKQLGKGWTLTLEGLYSKNINETYYTNINILPPVGKSVGAGPRNVYPSPNTIPITANGRNPYDNAILLSNNEREKGYSYNFTATVDKRFTRGFALNVNYSYGSAVIMHEPTSSVNLSQWRFMETANGRNFITRSVSDFSPGHRIFAYASKRFTYLNDHLGTTVTVVYTGQSGQPFSYVYGTNSAVRDTDPSGGFSSDLVYIPTTEELAGMTFLNNTVGSGTAAVTYTPAQQRAAFDQFIQANDYLKSRRGQFAERNGDRLPFTHVVDLKIAQDVSVRLGGKRIQFQVQYDVFNFTNLLNREWGRTYFLLNDQFRLLEFGNYVSNTNLTPQNRFNPTLPQPQSENNVSTSSAPSFSARWTSQLSFRVNF